MTNVQNQTRRGFLRTAGIGVAASLALRGGDLAISASGAEAPTTNKPARPVRLGLASYTLRKFDLDETLAMTQQVGLSAICLKSFHLPLDASPEDLAAASAKIKKAGLRLYGGGVIGMKNSQQVDQAFEYAKAAGMEKIVASPQPEMLPLINEKVQQHDIEVCIHNHGPGDRFFPTPEVVYELIKGLDRRVGLCHDIGHTLRYGQDPVAQTKNCANRILDIHLKDITEPTQNGRATPCGRGVIDLPAMMRTLVEIGFAGFASFEYEAQPEAPLAGLAESVGYINGVMDAMGA
jgi:inosose dehydratase